MSFRESTTDGDSHDASCAVRQPRNATKVLPAVVFRLHEKELTDGTWLRKQAALDWVEATETIDWGDAARTDGMTGMAAIEMKKRVRKKIAGAKDRVALVLDAFTPA